MNFSEEQLQLMEVYAAAFFSSKEIAVLLGFDIDEFIDIAEDRYSEVFKRCEAARLKSEFELRSEIIKMAKMGSPAAQTEALRIISNSK